MTQKTILLIHPPVAKPTEPPAGIARLAGAIRSKAIPCTVIDANIEGLYYLLENMQCPTDTWSRRAYAHMNAHLKMLRNRDTYKSPDKYRRAVADISRLLYLNGKDSNIRLGLADYRDNKRSPVRSSDLVHAAQHPEDNPYFDYFTKRILTVADNITPGVIGLSVNFLSQALCAFALIGLLRKSYPEAKIILGGGLISSWLNRPGWANPFSQWVDQMVSGQGETALVEAVGMKNQTRFPKPDYNDLLQQPYLSPGFILPFSASSGCWWRRCDFCPEKAEKIPYLPLPHTSAVSQLKELSRHTRPTMIHLLDNALSPALLKKLVIHPPGAPWYGFVRIGPPLNDSDFCRQLAQSGCTMLKLGLESGAPEVLKALKKGIDLETTSKVLRNLHGAGITSYVYLLFGTPTEDLISAEKTQQFIVDHNQYIDFLNIAVFNLPVGYIDTKELDLSSFYAGDLQLYSNFAHQKNWNRPKIRKFINKRIKKHPAIQPIIRKTPPIFTSNHAAFFS